MRKKLFLLITTVTFLIWLSFNSFCFPRQSYYRELIFSADVVEVHFLAVPHAKKYFEMAKIDNKQDLKILSESIRIRGIWLPLDQLSGNSYRIRAISADGQANDILIRGYGAIMHGGWTIDVVPIVVGGSNGHSSSHSLRYL